MYDFDYRDFAPYLRNIVLTSIEDNFEEEGRFGNGVLGGGNTSWEKSQRAVQQGGKTLQDTGGLAASVYVDVEAFGGLIVHSIDDELISIENDGFFDVEAGANKKVGEHYLSAIHQHGGNWKVPVTDSMKKYFWFMFKQTNDQKWKFMALTKKTHFDINMPARPFLVLQDSDIDTITNKFIEWIRKG